MDTPQSIGQKGGKAVLKKYGKKHFSKLGKMRWAKNKTKKKS